MYKNNSIDIYNNLRIHLNKTNKFLFYNLNYKNTNYEKEHGYCG